MAGVLEQVLLKEVQSRLVLRCGGASSKWRCAAMQGRSAGAAGRSSGNEGGVWGLRTKEERTKGILSVAFEFKRNPLGIGEAGIRDNRGIVFYCTSDSG